MNIKQAKRTNYNNLEEQDQLYGTPFPALEDGQNASKQELDQTVRDEQGRRRLHGAFTGGWSAGYYNSVGTKEGWTPSQFISRKNDRTSRKNFKPEDFMDDEDFGEHGIAPKQVKAKDGFLSTTDSFAGFRETINRQASTIDDVLKNVITAKPTSIGVKILKRMKKNAIQKLSKEHFMNNDKMFPLEFDENDLKSFFVNPKKTLNGLGYKRLTTNVNFSTDARLEQESKPEFSTVMKDGKKLKISGEAFGYGALDEDDGYEAEVYSFDDLSKYDYTLGGNKQQTAGRLFNSILSDSHLMDDFRKSDEHLNIGKLNVNMIKVPANWKPRPPVQKSVMKKRKSRWESNQDDQVKDRPDSSKDDKYRRLDATKRAELLGEDSSSLEREEIELKLKRKLKEEEMKRKSKEEEMKRKEEEMKLPKDFEEQIQRFKKPLSGFFANKFIQSTNTPLDQLKPGLTTIENLPQVHKPSKTESKEETKSFVGKSAREIYQFHPHKLLCKRLNVPHPYPQFPDVVGVLAMNRPKQDPDSFFPTHLSTMSNIGSTSTQQTIQQTSFKKEEVPLVIEEFKKPDLNLFRAVFDQSDDDELSEIEEIEELAEKDSTSDTQIEHVKSDLKTTPAVCDSNLPKLMFNKAFVKKDNSKPVEPKAEEKIQKSFVLSLFENEDLGSDDEGVNLLELKKKSESIQHLNSVSEDCPTVEPKKEEFSNCEHKFKKQKLSVENKFETKLNRSGLHSEESEEEICNVDSLLNEIMNPKSSHHKKKKKKHKEHKKHKKKHKSD